MTYWSRLRPLRRPNLCDGQVDRDLLLFRQNGLALAEREMGTPDADDGVVERCCPTVASLMNTWIRSSPPELTASIDITANASLQDALWSLRLCI